MTHFSGRKRAPEHAAGSADLGIVDFFDFWRFCGRGFDGGFSCLSRFYNPVGHVLFIFSCKDGSQGRIRQPFAAGGEEKRTGYD